MSDREVCIHGVLASRHCGDCAEMVGDELDELIADRAQLRAERDQLRAELKAARADAAMFHEQYLRFSTDYDKVVSDLEVARAALAVTETFEEAWARMEAVGYQYGHDALEQVRLGWHLAKGTPFDEWDQPDPMHPVEQKEPKPQKMVCRSQHDCLTAAVCDWVPAGESEEG